MKKIIIALLCLIGFSIAQSWNWIPVWYGKNILIQADTIMFQCDLLPDVAGIRSIGSDDLPLKSIYVDSLFNLKTGAFFTDNDSIWIFENATLGFHVIERGITEYGVGAILGHALNDYVGYNMPTIGVSGIAETNTSNGGDLVGVSGSAASCGFGNHYGVIGTSSATPATVLSVGVYGSSQGGMVNIGVSGLANGAELDTVIGVKGVVSGGGVHFAGYFKPDIVVTNEDADSSFLRSSAIDVDSVFSTYFACKTTSVVVDSFKLNAGGDTLWWFVGGNKFASVKP